MRIVKIQRVGQSARILPIHGKEGDIRGKSTRFYILVSGRPRAQELRDLVSFHVDKTGPRPLPVAVVALYVVGVGHENERNAIYKLESRMQANTQSSWSFEV